MSGDYVLHTSLRRARQAGTPASLTMEEWQQTINHFNGLCAYCLTAHWEQIEHFLPVETWGGGTTLSNCVPACASCNTCKDHPKFILLGNNEKAVVALTRVANYLRGLNAKDFNEVAVRDYINLQSTKVPKHHNRKNA